jgi:two-component system, LuxR family, response regulator FixJ
VRLSMKFPIVIIIYSDDARRASMRFLLEVEGWEVRDFKSPAEFLENPSPGCLVLEQDLPGMAGLELVEELRNRGMVLPVVLTTAQQDADFLARAMAAGANPVDSLSPTDVIGAISATIAGAVTHSLDQVRRTNT